jgi:Uma2 family endonuclease
MNDSDIIEGRTGLSGNTNMVMQNVKTIVSLLMQRPITEEIALQVGVMDDFKNLEIINGEWIGLDEQADDMTGESHGRIEGLLIILIGTYVLQNKLGYVYPGDTDFVLDGGPGDIRIKRQPDVVFVAGERSRSSSGYYYQAPDLAIEIISPSQSRPEMLAKASEYLRFGSKQVWIVFPFDEQIEIHYSDKSPEIYTVGDTISGGELIPGFELDVAKIFES